MKRLICLILMLLTAAALSACSGDSGSDVTSPGEETTAEAETAALPENTEAEALSMYDLSKAMCAADDTLPEMSRISSSDTNAAELFSYFSKMDYEKVDAYFLSYSAAGTAEEIGVIALKDEKDADACKKSLDDHVQDRINLYKTYAPEQVQRAEKAVIVTAGRYVALIMSDKKDAVTEAFLSFLEGK